MLYLHQHQCKCVKYPYFNIYYHAVNITHCTYNVKGEILMNTDDFISTIKLIFCISRDDELAETERLQQIANLTYKIIDSSENEQQIKE